MSETDPTALFHEALEALAQGNLSLAHDKALKAAAQYALQGSLSSAKMATEVALRPEILFQT